MYKLLKIIALLLGVAGTALWVALVAFEGDTSEYMFYISYVLLGVSVLASVLSALRNILASPKALKKTLLAVVVTLVVGGLSYVLADGEGTEKVVDTGLIAFYVLAATATILLIVSGVKGALTK